MIFKEIPYFIHYEVILNIKILIQIMYNVATNN
jgi:hypothetical protein